MILDLDFEHKLQNIKRGLQHTLTHIVGSQNIQINKTKQI